MHGSDGHHHQGPPVRQAGRLLELPPLELARLAFSEQALEASIGMAVINALLEVDEQRCREENALETIRREGEDKRVALVGHFPFIARLRRDVGELWVLELRPGEVDLSAEEAVKWIPRADVVALTATALINHTIEDLLALCRPGAYVVILGPTTPLSPLLFECGVTALAGSLVQDVDTVLRCVSQGVTFQQMRGVRTVLMTEQYRGTQVNGTGHSGS